jgi:hypothetical protein
MQSRHKCGEVHRIRVFAREAAIMTHGVTVIIRGSMNIPAPDGRGKSVTAAFVNLTASLVSSQLARLLIRESLQLTGLRPGI